jgi:hypothetical protein
MSVAYVTVSTKATGSSNSLLLNLPASRVNGNALVAGLLVENADGGHTWPAGWTRFLNVERTGLSVSLAYRDAAIDGTETAPTPSWTNAANCNAVMWQISGQDLAALIGATNTNSGSGTTASATAVNTTSDGSMMFIFIASAVATAVGTNTGYTEPFDDGTNARMSVQYLAVPTSGTSSGAVSVSVGNQPWIVALFEIKAVVAVQSIAVTAATATWSGVTPTVTKGAVSRSVTSALATWSGITVTPVKGALSIAITAAIATWQAVTVNYTDGSRTGWLTAIAHRINNIIERD